MARLFQSLIQSDFGGSHKNFEAVVPEGRDLWHWFRDNSNDDHVWKRGQRIVANVALFPGSIVQSDFRSGDHGNFEVVVPVVGVDGTAELWHFWHDNSDVTKPWALGQRITEFRRRVAGPASIIQSDFKSGDHGNFEVAVPVFNDAGGIELWHYFHDNSDVTKPWQRAQRINDPSHQILGGGYLIQSDFGSGDHGNFEVAAWVRLPDGRPALQHYWHDNSDVTKPWSNGQTIAIGAQGNGAIFQSSFGSEHGNFEVVVPMPGPGGTTLLQHFWHDNSDVTAPWRLGQVVTEVCSRSGSATFIESDYRSGDHGNFELLVDECAQSLVAYWHPSSDVTLPWIRHALLLGEPLAKEIRATERICQLTGEFDRTGWNGVGQPPFAFNKTETRFGLRGTDLGASFEHKNRVYFLFGDTWRLGESRDSHFDWDAIAFCTDLEVKGGLSLTFYKDPPKVPGISQGGFEVPLDGFSFNDLMFVFFSTGHRTVGDAELMGRSVIAVSENDGYDFVALQTFSSLKFINVSTERAQLDVAQSRALGWPVGEEVLWIWGSGRYRGSPAHLAVVRLSQWIPTLRPAVDGRLDNRPDSPAILFYSGSADHVAWSQHEDDAAPLFCAGDIGELSGRLNRPFNRYFITYNSGNPRGIVLRHALHPWGPWSEAIVIFDPGWGRTDTNPFGLGYGRFMHVPWNVAKIDHVQDDAFLQGNRDNDWSGEYGPYQITRYSVGVPGRSCDLVYSMSTWNPYEAVLMRTRITAHDLGL